nr:hypothetical protein [Chenggangzhangella methanolivorans]
MARARSASAKLGRSASSRACSATPCANALIQNWKSEPPSDATGGSTSRATLRVFSASRASTGASVAIATPPFSWPSISSRIAVIWRA